MKHRLRTKEVKQIYALRKSTVETVCGVIKQEMGFRQFPLRGKANVSGGWNLGNLKRLHKMTLNRPLEREKSQKIAIKVLQFLNRQIDK